MRHMLRHELYKFRCRRWFFPLFLLVILLLALMLGADIHSFRFYTSRSSDELAALGLNFSDEGALRHWYDTVYGKYVLLTALADGRPALLSGLVVSILSFGVDKLDRGSCSATYAGVPRHTQLLSRLLLTWCFELLVVEGALLLHLMRFVPHWIEFYSPGTLCCWLGSYLLSAVAAASMNVLAIALFRDFFHGLGCSAAVTFWGLLLTRESTAEFSVLKKMFMWYPCILQQGLFVVKTSLLKNTAILLGTSMIYICICLAVFRKQELK